MSADIPTVNVPASIYDPALAWCNERRAEKGLGPVHALPAGQAGEASSCPCSEACGAYVYEDRWGWSPHDPDHEPYGRFGEAHPLCFPRYFDQHAGMHTVPVLPVRVPDEEPARG